VHSVVRRDPTRRGDASPAALRHRSPAEGLAQKVGTLGLAGGQTNEPWARTSPVQGGRAEIGKVVGRPEWKTSLGVMAPPGDS
jgi:hypothetical protein